MSYGYRTSKTEMGSCTPRSRSARWESRQEAKTRSRKNRRRADRELSRNVRQQQ